MLLKNDISLYMTIYNACFVLSQVVYNGELLAIISFNSK